MEQQAQNTAFGCHGFNGINLDLSKPFRDMDCDQSKRKQGNAEASWVGITASLLHPKPAPIGHICDLKFCSCSVVFALSRENRLEQPHL